jgi:hypothetical protein
MADDKLVKAIDDATTEIEAALERCNASALAALPALKQAVTLAGGVQRLRRALSDDIMQRIFMPLQNTVLGFLTDQKQGYDIATVRDCVIEAMIKGAQPVNNEFNIISGRCYIAKNGLKRMVMQWPGLTNLVVTPGVPEMAPNSTALIAMRATWIQDGKRQELYRGKTATEDTRIAVRVNAGMGPDAIIGKAERKLYKAIFEVLSGHSVTIDDGDAIDTVGQVVAASEPAPVPGAEQEGRRIKMGNGKAKPIAHDAQGVVQDTAPEPGSDG